MQALNDEKITFKTFFKHVTIHPNAHLIKRCYLQL